MNNECNSGVRVRFAPSPTGYLHIGSVRSALFNWLFARHNKGAFLLRIEDTDLERSTKEYADSILSSLEWLGMTSDAPAVYQSSLIDRHRAYVEKLLGEGKAYKCYCSRQELEKRLGEGCGYDKRCRTCTPPSGDKSYVVRFRLPDDRKNITVKDIILGDIVVPLDSLDDFIIARSDGSPIYNFVVVVDDATMNISHVIRGQDHIDNTAKQLLLYEALDFTVPRFAHIPLILGKSGNRLSKRDAATSILSYKESGYLPEAMLNYLARLGWSHGDQELFTIDELISDFSLKEVGKSNATFDIEKLRWVNSEHIKKKTASQLLDYIIKHLNPDICKKLSSWSEEQVLLAIDLYKKRVTTLCDLVDKILQLHESPKFYDTKIFDDFVCNFSNLQHILERLRLVPNWDKEEIQKVVKQQVEALKIKLVDVAVPIRVALTGKTKAPGIFDLLVVLGKEESINRLEAFLKQYNK